MTRAFPLDWVALSEGKGHLAHVGRIEPARQRRDGEGRRDVIDAVHRQGLHGHRGRNGGAPGGLLLGLEDPGGPLGHDDLHAGLLYVLRDRRARGDAVAAPGEMGAHTGGGALEGLAAVDAAEGPVAVVRDAGDLKVLVEALVLGGGVGAGARGGDGGGRCLWGSREAGEDLDLCHLLREARLEALLVLHFGHELGPHGIGDGGTGRDAVAAPCEVPPHAGRGALELLLAVQALQGEVGARRAVRHDLEVLHDGVRTAVLWSPGCLLHWSSASWRRWGQRGRPRGPLSALPWRSGGP